MFVHVEDRISGMEYRLKGSMKDTSQNKDLIQIFLFRFSFHILNYSSGEFKSN